MIYAYKHKPTGDILVQEADDDEESLAVLLDNKLIASPDDVDLVEMGKVVRIRATIERDHRICMQLTGEEELLGETPQ